MASLMRTVGFMSAAVSRVSSRCLSVTPVVRSDIIIKDYNKPVKLIEVEEKTDVSVLTGVPEEQIKTRHVRIYTPTKNAMQSGTNKTKHWHIEFDTQQRWENPLMGWSSSGDPLSNMDIKFTDVEDAISYCESNGWEYHVDDKQSIKLRPKNYGSNFHWSKKTRVSTK